MARLEYPADFDVSRYGLLLRRILTNTRSDVQRLISEQKVTFESLDDRSKTMLRLIEENKKIFTDHVDGAFIDYAKQQTEQRAQAVDQKMREANRLRLLSSLKFPDMKSRVNTISDHSGGTFDWILDLSCEPSQAGFATWVVDWNSEPIFWICGTAGSGRSTLMRRIWSDEQTSKLLSQGDGDHTVSIIKHSFWLQMSNVLQKNFKGMLHALVHDVLDSSDSATEWLLSSHHNLHRIREHGDWDEKIFRQVLSDLLNERVLFDRVCIFLDALDEIELATDHKKTLQLINELSSLAGQHIKICTSSRSERPWLEVFDLKPQLKLENLPDLTLRPSPDRSLREDFRVILRTTKKSRQMTFCPISLTSQRASFSGHIWRSTTCCEPQLTLPGGRFTTS